ncbi:hypothetical protein comes_25950 [Coprococcus comes]|uniref:Uncharacterized protein n=1 Tax=Coprococcus comes TaxID=410072 RepID=A0AA37VFA9_9FIRM|nr:hypothetical protein comes_25950 [Coprococcus comes]
MASLFAIYGLSSIAFSVSGLIGTTAFSSVVFCSDFASSVFGVPFAHPDVSVTADIINAIYIM